MSSSDDLFEAVLNVEEDMINNARSEGIELGKRAGLVEGVDMGLKKGYEYGSEIGYYYGWCLMWLQISSQVRPLPSRSVNTLERLHSLISNYMKNLHPEYQRLEEDIEEIRRNYKIACTQMGIAQTKSEDNLSF